MSTVRTGGDCDSGDQGVAAVELAIILPVFLAVVLGGIAFGLIFREQIMLRNAAANAASYAAVQPCDLGDSSSGITFQALAELQHVTVLQPKSSDVTVTTTFVDSNGNALTGSDACLSASQVEVSVKAPYNSVSDGLLSVFDLSGGDVVGQDVVQIQGRPQ